MTEIKLSDAQAVILSAACQRPDRCVFPITTTLKGNAAGNVLKSLLNKGLIREIRASRDDTVWRHDEEQGRMTLTATEAALNVLGIEDAEREQVAPDAETNADDATNDDAASDATSDEAAAPKSRRSRDNSKQAQLIAMLRRPDGATIDEAAAAMGWQSHTVRGALAGALKKKLGLTIGSEKVEGRGRIYKIVD